MPDYEAPIDADYLPGRNVFLLGLTAVWCGLHDVAQIALGSLMTIPSPDATPEFFADYRRAAHRRPDARDRGADAVPRRRKGRADPRARGPAAAPDADLHEKPSEAPAGGARARCTAATASSAASATMLSSRRAWRTRRGTRSSRPS